MNGGEKSGSGARGDVTQLLRAVGEGDSAAAAELLPLVYEELRALAAARMHKTPVHQTLQPTALVHEAYLRLVGTEDPSWDNRGHFFFAAARAMHDILVDQARRKASRKRGGGWQRGNVDQLVIAIDAPPDDLLALSDALEKLEKEDERGHKLVMLRFFGGLSLSDAAEAMNISRATAKRDWHFARTRLHKELTGPLTSALAIKSDE
jgi:RNA polymerase sigma factor (TIGR02999 family)